MESTINWNTGEWIKNGRNRKGLSVKEMADELDLRPRKLREWEEFGCNSMEAFENITRSLGYVSLEVPDGSISARLCWLRGKTGLSRKYFSERLPDTIDIQMLGRWERGYARPTNTHLRTIATSFDIPYEWLAKGDKTKRPTNVKRISEWGSKTKPKTVKSEKQPLRSSIAQAPDAIISEKNIQEKLKRFQKINNGEVTDYEGGALQKHRQTRSARRAARRRGRR